MKAPFPYFGGKSAVAAEVWRRFGDVSAYVEPFAGSCAVLLKRPHWSPGKPLRETVNDTDGLLCNFWRAVKYEHAAVIEAADWPVNETEMRARHAWLVGHRESIADRLEASPKWYDAEAAGWWVWSMAANAIPRGLHTDAGSVVSRGKISRQGMDAAFASGTARTRVAALASRLRHVRVLCGEWSRVVQSPTMMCQPPSGALGVFLDPPYAGTDAAYATEAGPEVAAWAWALEHGGTVRVCVAGYDDGRDVPPEWATVKWSPSGGMANRAKGERKSQPERLWFSPACLSGTEQLGLAL